MAVHELKIWPDYFDAVRTGAKPFEVRKNDRAFEAGDTLILHEFEPATTALGTTPGTNGNYTGRRTDKYVTYVMPGGQWGIAPDMCILGIR